MRQGNIIDQLPVTVMINDKSGKYKLPVTRYCHDNNNLCFIYPILHLKEASLYRHGRFSESICWLRNIKSIFIFAKKK